MLRREFILTVSKIGPSDWLANQTQSSLWRVENVYRLCSFLTAFEARWHLQPVLCISSVCSWQIWVSCALYLLLVHFNLKPTCLLVAFLWWKMHILDIYYIYFHIYVICVLIFSPQLIQRSWKIQHYILNQPMLGKLWLLNANVKTNQQWCFTGISKL